MAKNGKDNGKLLDLSDFEPERVQIQDNGEHLGELMLRDDMGYETLALLKARWREYQRLIDDDREEEYTAADEARVAKIVNDILLRVVLDGNAPKLKALSEGKKLRLISAFFGQMTEMQTEMERRLIGEESSPISVDSTAEVTG